MIFYFLKAFLSQKYGFKGMHAAFLSKLCTFAGKKHE